MKFVIFLLSVVALPAFAQSDPSILSSWIINTTGETGYSSLPCNIQKVEYSDSNVYVNCSCIPGYSIGPWHGNPNVPTNQNFIFKFTRKPQPNTGTQTATPLGHIGILSNGVSIFNANDGNSYNNDGTWHSNAVQVEGSSFDGCMGHADQTGEYHHHLNPVCLYDQNDSTRHSPIIGYAFDGYPIYGMYGYVNADGTGGIRRMRSSYRLRNITERTTLPNGTPLSSNQYGPAVSKRYPLGYYIEDFEYVAGFGDLDAHNGRFCVTPDYPNGTYAYFVTVDSTGTAAYPYTIGPTYYGIVTNADIGPRSGHLTISEPVLTYTPSSEVKPLHTGVVTLSLYPNPASNWLIVEYSSTRDYATHIEIADEHGVSKYSANMRGPETIIPIKNLPAGNYIVVVATSSGQRKIEKMAKE